MARTDVNNNYFTRRTWACICILRNCTYNTIYSGICAERSALQLILRFRVIEACFMSLQFCFHQFSHLSEFPNEFLCLKRALMAGINPGGYHILYMYTYVPVCMFYLKDGTALSILARRIYKL